MTPQRNYTPYIILFFILLIVAVVAYWYIFLRGPSTSTVEPSTDSSSNGFNPISRPGAGRDTVPTPSQTGTQSSSTPVIREIPKLRLLSDTPVGGYGFYVNPTSTIVRWVDRGRGNISETNGKTLDVTTLSNTRLPRVYESAWNANLSSFIATLVGDKDEVSTVYSELTRRPIPRAASTSPEAASLTPYTLRGKNLAENITVYASSPKKDKLFFIVQEGDESIGYTSTFDGKNIKQIFVTPLTQINVEWPEEGTIAITTKGASDKAGFLYFVNPKTGVWRKILGPLPGLSTRTSRDAKFVIFSVSGKNQTVLTSIYNIEKGTGNDAVIRTLADKCVWGNFYWNTVYCAVPSQPVAATYPDDWYTGSVSLVDKIWQVSASTGELHLISSLVDQSDRLIDAYNLGIDAKDDYLFFMNKNDLSLWSLDLIKAQ